MILLNKKVYNALVYLQTNIFIMKWFLFAILFACSITGTTKIIENPAFDKSDTPTFFIKKVEITTDTTYVFCSYYAKAGSWASISKETYLRDSKSHKTFSIQRCEGLPYSPETREFSQNKSCELLFCFPSIAGTEQFDFIETEGEIGFNIYGVSLKKQIKASYTNAELKQISEMVSAYNSNDTEKTMLLKDYATSLNNLESYNLSMGKYEEAIRLGTVELKVIEIVFGKSHSSYLELLSNLAEYHSALGNYSNAVLFQTEAIEVIKNTIGSNNSNYAIALSYLASYHAMCGNYTDAVLFQTEAIEVLKNTIGTYSKNYAAALGNLAYYNSELGNYYKAIEIEKEAMEIFKKVIGTNHPDYTTFICRLASYYSLIGNYADALQLEAEAIELFKNTIGTYTKNYAVALGNLALYNSELGNYYKAIEIEKEAMGIIKNILGDLHPDYCISLGNLANYYAMCGNYVEAIRLGTESMEITKRVLGAEHPNHAKSLSNLASYNWSCGNYMEAIRLNIEAMEICKKVWGDKHPNYAWIISNLATCYSECDNYAEAIKLNTEAMEIRKNALGTEHPDYATSLDNLATDNYYCGYYASAKYYATEAMKVRKRVLGTEHPTYAITLSHLASIYSDLGNNAEAIKLETEAMDIFKSVFGTEHLNYSRSLGNLADSYSKLGDYEKAYFNLKQKIELSHFYIMNNLRLLSSNIQKSLWTKEFEYTFFKTFPLLVSKYNNKESISDLYNNTCLFAKGILLNTSIEMRKLILESRDPVLINKYNTLSKNINIYNKLVEKPLKERNINTDSLNNVIQKQEMELSRESKVFGGYTRNLTITWKDVQCNLGNDDIAIEFLDYPLVGSNSTMYVALTLKKDYDSPHMVTLFERNQLKTIPENVYYTQTDVSDIIWKPLEEELKDVKNIYFAPSGELHKIGIEYLPISKTENICDVYTLHRLSSTRQLAVVQDETKGKNTILYGGINYDEKSNINSTDSASIKEPVLRTAFTYRANVDSLSLRNSYDYLEGTKKEADMIAEDMERHRVPYNYYSDTDATEESFKHLDGTMPKVMHIATHGFYFTEEEAVKSQFARPEMELLIDGGLQTGRIVEQKPMTRSGLLFSGCNRTVRHEKVPDEEEDGILTAQEISTLDLRGLDLVVLSACQTGLGDIVSGEGVFGLQRGFKKAGAKTIIMSLWNVNDESTMKMMTSFYHHYLNGMSKEEAFYTAQDELKKVSPSQQERPDWAAFIMLDGIK